MKDQNFALVQCRNCRSAAMEPVKLLGGISLPYGGGLVKCGEQGIGYYPNQLHSCPDFKKSSPRDINEKQI
jgi:hypothetical protein